MELTSCRTIFANPVIVRSVTFSWPISMRDKYCCLMPASSASSNCLRPIFNRAACRFSPNTTCNLSASSMPSRATGGVRGPGFSPVSCCLRLAGADDTGAGPSGRMAWPDREVCLLGVPEPRLAIDSSLHTSEHVANPIPCPACHTLRWGNTTCGSGLGHNELGTNL
jgi:hypothetical protein